MNVNEQPDVLTFLNGNLKGISKFHLGILPKLCGGNKVVDLLFYKPLSYVDRSKSLLDAQVGELATFIAKVYEHQLPTFRGRPYKIVVESESHCIFIVFFNYSIKYLYRLFPIGASVIISGKLEKFAENWQIAHPDYVLLDTSQFKKIACIEPVYRLCRGITNKSIRNIMDSYLKELSGLPEWISDTLIKQNKWLSWKESIIKLHRPDSLAEAEACRRRLAYDELFAYQMALKFARESYVKKGGREFAISNRYKEQVLNELSFQLTNDQIRAIDEISERQKSKCRMVSLLQGDVGSGKTVVALFVMLNVIENNMQVALMAPTTILAEQHYNWIEEVLSYTDIKVALLTGKTACKERRIITNELASGILNIIIGTHTLFQANVTFKNLGLAVIDEQQRFGVMQRNCLVNKGESVDILFITATPIPRTLQQAIYGDVEYSILREKPKSRLPIKTVAINIKKLADVIEKLKSAINRGGKAYWICPYIEGNEGLNIAAAEMRFQELQKTFFDKVRIVHGKLTQDQKDQVMFSFKKNEFPLLVATTVIEVGIDVPDATIMIIENAERFGLSQLHQLRGRVGRGNKPSFCVLLYDNLSKSSSSKLKIMCESQDGFYIAEKDMMLRGSGDILGLKQSGCMEFKFADLYKDKKLLNLAYNNAKSTAAENKSFELLLDIFEYRNRLHFSKLQ
ncbi:DEAD/DEAH box helicase [Wolbachia endosymbiont of Litomosoides brasiliensis]|uniref:ATP-dependent DNA helicase RecG n=1 Tax=Wolbachia endosymbiont of Litomosoides brasiliensis TaxID=1812117 RepID=UPI00158967F7|nr:ATP-dependent DNA helicase RecG [Wolbachia endosymbiont of Litomosoides brasiliensis]NUY39335.1 DEAD/DEAH box helicase [Wolbachia endosymbiont of Litomosoides brasiliensis]